MTTASNFENLETLDVSVENQVAHVRINRPDKLNSMTKAFWGELPMVVRTIDDEALARAIVVSSTGKHFSAGMDLAQFQDLESVFGGDPSRRAEHMRRWILWLQETFTAFEEVRMPVLVAVQGACIGGAVDLTHGDASVEERPGDGVGHCRFDIHRPRPSHCGHK